MDLPVFTHPDMLAHRPGVGHPERPQRLAAVLDALQGVDLPLQWLGAPLAERADLQRVHPAAFVDAVLGAEPDEGVHALDPDTLLSPGSAHAGLRAAGAVVQAVRHVWEGRSERGA